MMVALAFIDGRRDAILFLGVAGVASGVYGLAAWTVVKATPASRRGLWVCLALAVAARAPLLLAEPTVSDDLYRYIWDGRLQRFGHNPYVSPPGDPALQHLHTDVTRRAGHQTLPSLYPPVALWFFRGVASVSESVFAFKLAFVACDLLIVMLLLRWLARAGRSPWHVLVYAWNPLVIIEVAGSGHVDVLGALLLFVSFMALEEGHGAAAAMAFAAAVEVKLLPFVLLPLLWRRLRVRDGILACAVGLALATPFLVGAGGPSLGSLPTYLEKWRFNAPAFVFIEHFVRGRWLTALPLGVGLAAAGLLRRWHPAPFSWAWPMAAALLVMVTVYPWYLLWFVPFLGTIETLPLLVWTQSVLLTYFVWHVVAIGGAWDLPAWVLIVEFGSVACAGGWLAWRRAGRRDSARRTMGAAG
jgi:hypothetical protein